MFERALALVLKYEGGYVNNPNDPGGATNKGITQATYDSYRRRMRLPQQSVKSISDLEVAFIYEMNYWRDGKSAEIARFYPYLAAAHFDFGVNAGIGRAARILQSIVKVEVDGVIGPKTLAAIKEYPEFDLIELYSEARNRYYRRIVAGRARSLEFLRGWLVRTAQIEGRMHEYRAADRST